MFAELKRYRNKHGDCKVPPRWPENPQLAAWVAHQRTREKELPSARKARLNELGFVWELRDAAWETKFAELKRYRDEHGDCNVPTEWEDNPQLGRWVHQQRTREKELSPARKARLDKLGFIWNFDDFAWETMFAELQRYRDKHGNCNVPYMWRDNLQLGTWVSTLRARKKRGTISADQKVRLDTLGFVWETQDLAWQTMFNELTRYKELYGDCNIPRKWNDNPQLSKWVDYQRNFNKNSKLCSARKARLNELGFVWEPRDADWETMFAELKRYRDQHGDCNVLTSWQGNPRLAAWIANQRTREKELSPARKARLNELGFVWEPRDAAWETKFAELKRYRDEHGDCNVPQGYRRRPQLASWVTVQRYCKNKGRLSAVRKARLDELGFVWEPHDSAWQEMFAALKRYSYQHGDCNVPGEWEENPQLGTWVSHQRRFNIKGETFPSAQSPTRWNWVSMGQRCVRLQIVHFLKPALDVTQNMSLNEVLTTT